MKRVFSVVVVVLSLLMVFQQAFMIVCFKLNQDAIEQRFCINKNAPELQCHGACHLKKKLQDAESKDSTVPTFKGVDMLFFPIPLFEVKNLVTEIRTADYSYQQIAYEEPGQEVILPPPWFV
ncbi:hypothetical protein [Pedobacter arcticus]|uniref:hypothetical protein n=1 Tax=Pedobacter arcticus TaxID=752140 RepID=UPI000367ECE9|nr:hypothetical protein [Pedobacter arcticus]